MLVGVGLEPSQFARYVCLGLVVVSPYVVCVWLRRHVMSGSSGSAADLVCMLWRDCVPVACMQTNE